MNNEDNKIVIARIFGVKAEDVGDINIESPVDSYMILFEPASQLCFYRGDLVGVPEYWSITNDEKLSIVTDKGQEELVKALPATLAELSSLTGANQIFEQQLSVSQILRTLGFLESLGFSSSVPKGINEAGLRKLMEYQGEDYNLHIRGGHYAGKPLYGIRENAVVTSFRAGRDSNGIGRWNPQVTGVSNNIQLAQYGSPDKVGAYGDISSTNELEYQKANTIISFTEDGFFTDNESVLANAKVGMIVVTSSEPKKWNIIKSVNKDTGEIIGWDKWADESGYVKPVNNEKVVVDPEGKLWVVNYNLLLDEGGRSKNGVIAELGIKNNSGNSSSVNGIDIVTLPSSTSDCDTGLLIRGGGSEGRKGWLTGISVRGYKNHGISFVKTGEYTAESDIRFTTNSSRGIEFSGGHLKYSMSWRLGGTGPFSSIEQTLLDSKGFVVRSGVVSKVITSSEELSANIKSYRINISAVEQVLTLPNTEGISSGHEQYLKIYKSTPFIVTSYNQRNFVSIENGGNYTTQTWSPQAGKEYKLEFDGTYWKIWG